MRFNPYIRGHLLAFWMSMSAVLIGIPMLISPAFGSRASTSLAIMPDLGVMVWGAGFALGGVMILAGLFRMLPKWEAAGSTLLSAAFLALCISAMIVEFRPVSLVFLGSLSLGFLHRAVSLIRGEASGKLEEATEKP